MEHSIAVLLQPELFHMLQVIKRHGPGVRFFSDDNTLAETTHLFSTLRRQLRSSNTPSLNLCLAPFRALFRTNDCNSAILASALGSLAKLFRSNFFELFAAEDAILEFRRLTMTIAQCRFDVGELSGDEIALQRMLDVLLLAMRSKLSIHLGDHEVGAVIELCFSTCVLTRVGELFRRQAELACIELCSILLGRVKESGFVQTMPLSGVISIAYPGTRSDDPEPLPPALAALEAELEKEKEELEKANEDLKVPQETRPTIKSPVSSIGDTEMADILLPEAPIDSVPPYSMTIIIELLFHLVRLLEISELRNTDRMRSLCLVILTDFVEKNHKNLPELPLIWEFTTAKLTRVLVQLLMSESPSLMLHLHQAILSIFGRFRRHLLAPTELFISTLISLLIQKPPPGKQPRISREYYLDIMSHFCLDPTFLADMYVLYECGSRFGYSLTDFISALVSTVQLDSKQVVGQDYFFALEVLILILQSFDSAGSVVEADPDPEKLCKDRNFKFLMRKAAELFNKEPKDSFAFLAESGVTSSPATPQEIAQFLRRTAGLDKKVIGEIVSKPTNLEILKEFLADFNLAGLQIDEALRVVLESFRLPGESQQISRIMESLAQAYYRSQTGGVFLSEDAVFILTYSIIMLNTDQHNKQVRHRMTVDDFIRNNRGINDGKNFEEDFLKRIFLAIQSKEIVMPEEQAGETAFNYIWNEQLKKYSINQIPPVFILDAYLQDILKLLWKPLVSCFRSLILSPKSDTGSKLAVRGLYELGCLAGRFLDETHLDELGNVFVECMAFSEIATNPTGNQLSRYLARSELFKVLVKCFFDIYRMNGSQLADSWKPFVKHILFLVQSSIVNLTTFEVEVGGLSGLMSRSTANSPRSDKNESGLFSALSQYLVSSPVDPSGVDSETRNKAIEFIRTCRLEEIIRDSRFLPEASLQHLISAMTEQLKITRPLAWEVETLVFLVDLVVHTAWINRDRMSTFWPSLFNRFSELAKDLSAPTFVREHVILGLGRLSLRFADRPEMQKEVVQFFQLLCYVPTESFQSLAEPALSIVLRIVELDPPILHGTAIWPHYFTVLALAGRSRSCGPYSFGLLTTIVRENELLFPLEFFSEYVDLLSGFVASSTTVQTSSSPLSASGDIIPSPVELAGQALGKFALLEANIRRLAASNEISGDSVWHDYVIPIHCAVAQQCYHPIREIRQQALPLLQRIILNVDFSSRDVSCIYEEFQMVLLPLLEELKRPELSRLEGLEELQVRSTSVVAKILLPNLPVLFSESKKSECVVLFGDLLTHMLHFLSGRGDLLRESIPETLKNMLMVMASSGYLRSPQPGEDSALWDCTWRLLDPVIPTFKQAIMEVAIARNQPGIGVNSVPRSRAAPTGFLDQMSTNTDQSSTNTGQLGTNTEQSGTNIEQLRRISLETEPAVASGSDVVPEPAIVSKSVMTPESVMAPEPAIVSESVMTPEPVAAPKLNIKSDPIPSSASTELRRSSLKERENNSTGERRLSLPDSPRAFDV